MQTDMFESVGRRPALSHQPNPTLTHKPNKTPAAAAGLHSEGEGNAGPGARPAADHDAGRRTAMPEDDGTVMVRDGGMIKKAARLVCVRCGHERVVLGVGSVETQHGRMQLSLATGWSVTGRRSAVCPGCLGKCAPARGVPKVDGIRGMDAAWLESEVGR